MHQYAEISHILGQGYKGKPTDYLPRVLGLDNIQVVFCTAAIGDSSWMRADAKMALVDAGYITFLCGAVDQNIFSLWIFINQLYQ